MEAAGEKRRAARKGDAATGARQGWVRVRGSEAEVEMETVREDGNKRGKLKKKEKKEEVKSHGA